MTKVVLTLILVMLHVALVLCGTNYYKLLGIPKNSNAKQIKKAYREKSKLYHPDKNPGDEVAQQKFVEVATAYEVLSDKEKRRVYDTQGEEGLERLNKQKQQGGRNPFGMFNPFGFGGRQAQEKRGPDFKMKLRVTLQDLYTGRSREVDFQGQVLCPQCRGSGAEDDDDVKTCKKCGGKGVELIRRQLAPGFVQQVQQQCSKCGGKGKIVKNKCKFCRGTKVATDHTTLDVPIEQGMPDGGEITFENSMDEQPEHAGGHLIFVISTVPDERFRRDGDDLHYTQHLTLKQALLGYNIDIEHLDGHLVHMERTGVTHPDSVRTFKEEGMPVHQTPSDKGKLFVKFHVDFPETLTQEQKDEFSKLL